MRSTTTKRAFSALVGLALVATACGSDDDSSDGDDAEAEEADAETAASEAVDDAETAASDAVDEAETEASDAVDEAETDSTEASGDDSGEAASGDGVRLGILAECEGPFGGFYEDNVAGATLALVEGAGATVNSTTTALDGFEGAEVAGTSIELVGIGCGDDTPDRAIQEIRTLVEQNGANVVIGPLSGDEGTAVANYALDNPEVTFINGIAGAQETTLHVQAPNFFRYTGDGAQWNAGIGDILVNEAGWETAAVIADDYGFGWTSAAGFTADFCAAGGEITSQVFPPLGTTDYSSFVQQLPDPDEVDGYFWVVGGTGTNAALEAFLNAKGDLTGDQHAGNLFFSPALAEALGTDIGGAYVGGFASLPGDIQTPEIEAYLASADETWESLASGAGGGEVGPASVATGFGFGYGYYAAGTALVAALEEVGGDISDGQAALQESLAGLELDLPYGTVTLDENNQAIVDTFVAQLVVNDDGEVVQETKYIVPGVDQTFGGTYSSETDPPERDNTPCEEKDLPWQGNEIPVVDGVPES
ncbi:ABC transporter substrate-binding protein [Ilumatobacter nonamiensis]|uniref:ABC transporter substrate-binding protein n=1 Tax=Ilumatobacter nonamiensis TaxID=467093 RepID=UPI000349FC5E|nr:ABC transporter substrate-binding protein [Ilumatobacter nonamiensis]